MHRAIISFFFICLVSLLALPPQVSNAAQLDRHTFPKLANYFLKWELTDAEARELARWDLLVLDMEVQEKSTAALKKIRQINPDIVILAYVTSQEIMVDASTSYSTLRRQLHAGIDPSWWLRDTSGNRKSWWPGTYLLDMTNTSGWPTYLREFMQREVLATGLWDGIFYDNTWDNVTYFAGTDIDLSGNGTAEDRRAIDTAWQTGMRYLYTTTREQTAGKYIIVGNGTTKIYTGSLNGQLIENFTGGSAWAPTMQAYEHFEDGQISPTVNLINANTNNTGGQDNYRAMRFGLTSSLLEDGYYSFDYGDTAHNQTWWYDEYNIDLGDAQGPATSKNGSSEYSTDVWRRDFTNGISLVNSGNAIERVDLGGEFEKITGTQDTSVNDGSIVSELTLSGSDGTILLKTFEGVEDIVFTNGDFARFYTKDGERVRNGFFVFDENEAGGTKIARIDMNNNGIPEILILRRSRLEVYRDDGQLYMRGYPYGANYKGEIRVAVGDLDRNGFSELFVSPASGNAPIKVFARHGRQIRRDWYPFGESYSGGYSMAIGTLNDPIRNQIIIGAGTGSQPYVNVYDWKYNKLRDWFAYEDTFRGGVFVATGDIDGDGRDEIITGPGAGKGPRIRTFEHDGTLVSDFMAYETLFTNGIVVESTDVDFDGVDDIIGLSSGGL